MKKRILCFLIIAVMAVGFLPTLASAAIEGDFDGISWTFDEQSGTITFSGNGRLDYLDNRPWEPVQDDIKAVVVNDGITAIRDNAFSYTNVQSVTLAPSVKVIETCAFLGCYDLTYVSMPGVEEIANSAFCSCVNLENINIPDTVKIIGDSAFWDTKYSNNLENWENGMLYIGKYLVESDSSYEGYGDVTIKDGTRLIAYAAFYGCASLLSVTIPSSVEYIGNYAFSECHALKSVTVEEGVKNIGFSAFYCDYSLENVTLPDSIVSIEGDAFTSTAIFEDETKRENGVLYIGNHLIKADYTGFYGNYVVKEGTKCIGGAAFYDTWNLYSVSLPDSVVSISESAFMYCSQLESINFSKNLEYIGKFAFAHCGDLNVIKIPDSVTDIDENAFYGSSCNMIVLSKALTQIKKEVFASAAIKNLYLPKNVKTIGECAFGGADITRVLYSGSEQDANAIVIMIDNDMLDKAEWVYDQTELPKPSSIEIENGSKITGFVGVSKTLDVTVYPDVAMAAQLSWTSSNEDVVIVDDMGVLSFVGMGDATVTVSSGDVSDSIKVEVKPTAEMVLGDSIKAHGNNMFSFTPEEDGYYTFYSTSVGYLDSFARLYDSKMSEIDYSDDNLENGNFMIIYHMEADKTYYLETNTYTDFVKDTYTVNLEKTVNAQSIEIMNKENMATGGVGGNFWIEVRRYPAYSFEENYTITSSNEDVISIDGNQTFHLAPGTATITVTTENGLSDSVEITITERPAAEELRLSNEELKGIVGKYYDLDYYFMPYDCAIEEVEWTSDDESVATVDEEGIVTFVGAGTTTVRVESESGLYDTVEVVVIATPAQIACGDEATVNTTGDFMFVPEESGYYIFSSSSDGYLDTFATLYDSDYFHLESNDEGGTHGNFKLSYYFVAGQTYYFNARLYYLDEEDKSFKVTLQKAVQATSVTIDESALPYVGESWYPNIKFLPENAAPEEYEISSSDNNVIVVDPYGEVYFVGPGTATVTVTTENGLSDSIEITTIVRPEATGVRLSFESITSYVGERYYLGVSMIPEDAPYEEHWFTSSNEDVAIVDEYGSVELVGVGNAVITITTENGFTDSCPITVKEIIAAKVGDKIECTKQDDILRFSFTPEKDGYYSFRSESDEEVDPWGAICDSNDNYLTENDDGGENSHFHMSCYLYAGEKYFIQVGISDYSSVGDRCVVVVEEAVPATSFDIDLESFSCCVGTYASFSVSFYPQNSIVEDITWTVSDEDIAYMDYGFICFKREGTVTVTAVTQSGFTDTVVVTGHGHVYDNGCDTICNDCWWDRDTQHEWGEYVYNNDATTEADGTKTRTCAECGEEETVTAEGTKLPEGPAVTPDHRLPMVYLNEAGNGVVTDMRGSWATRVYWGNIGDENVEYKWFDDDFRLLCGTDYFADYAPRNEKSYYFTKVGYYRFVLKCIISGTDVSNYKYKDVVYTFYFDGQNVSVPSVELVDGNHVRVNGNGIKIKKFYYGNIGQTNTPYSWFNDFWTKSLASKSYKAVYGPRNTTEVTLSTKGYYNFVICFDDASGKYQELAYTVYAEDDVEIISGGNGKATVNLDNIGGTVNKLYWGYIGEDADGITDYDTLKAAAGTLSGDWDVKQGDSYTLSKPGYYGFCVNYSTKCLINGNENTVVTYDIIYIIENN